MAPALVDNKYEILGKLGEGGQGSVYKARHVGLDQIRAIKFISEQATENPEFLRRFQDEARTCLLYTSPSPRD